jgi:hypothetical protein
MGMSYSIGEVDVEIDPHEGKYDAILFIAQTEHPNAPTFPNTVPDSINNWDGMGWRGAFDLTEETKSESLFWGEGGFWNNNDPAVLNEESVRELANLRFERQLIDQRPAGYAKWNVNPINGHTTKIDDEKYDWIKAKLEWMEGWANHAIRNCVNPAIRGG